MPIPITIPPIFDMGIELKECEGDLFVVRKKEQSNNPLKDSIVYLNHMHLSSPEKK